MSKSSQEHRRANLTSRISTYYQEKARVHRDGQTVRGLWVFLRGANAKSWSFSWLGSVSRCGRRQVVHIVGMWIERGWGAGGLAAERRQVGRCVTASHWCLVSYVGINHDSEMTYFLTPQTNSTFNRSQSLCQTTFSPRSLSKVASGRIGLPRHNTEDVRFLSQAPSAALL